MIATINACHSFLEIQALDTSHQVSIPDSLATLVVFLWTACTHNCAQSCRCGVSGRSSYIQGRENLNMVP